MSQRMRYLQVAYFLYLITGPCYILAYPVCCALPVGFLAHLATLVVYHHRIKLYAPYKLQD